MKRAWLGLGMALGLIACGGEDASNTGSGGSGTGTPSGVGGGADGGGGTVDTTGPDPQFLPAPTGACPDFTQGTNTFSPAGIAARDVEIWVGDNPTAQDGPLVFYWHGTGSDPVLEPPYGLGSVLTSVVEAGGVVAAAHSAPDSGQFPWYLTTGGTREDDLLVADEVLACAMEKVGIDTSRIHSIGMSAGGLQTTQMSYRRNGYLASVVAYSGGLLGTAPELPDPNNKFAAMIMHGGSSDVVIVEFQTLSESYRDDLIGRGHFAFICDHGLGHDIPKQDNAQAAVGEFFAAHPYGTTPSPFEAGLPGTFPSWCSL